MSNNQNTLDQNILRQVFFILIILTLGLLLFFELSFFLPAVLGSLTLYILMRERMHYLTEVKKWSKPKAAWLLMVLSFLVILLPFGVLANLLTSKIVYAVEHSNQILDSLKSFSEDLKTRFGFALADDTTINEIGPFIRKIIPQILSITVNTISIIGVLYFVLYFMLIYSRTLEDKLYEYIPLKDSNVDLIANDIGTTGKSKYNRDTIDCVDTRRSRSDRIFIYRRTGSVSLVCHYMYYCHASRSGCRVSVCTFIHNFSCTGKKLAGHNNACLWVRDHWPRR